MTSLMLKFLTGRSWPRYQELFHIQFRRKDWGYIIFRWISVCVCDREREKKKREVGKDRESGSYTDKQTSKQKEKIEKTDEGNTTV